jgi:UDP-hydrolysing UDP-N-acetyl-D-glucosamine 2-epimerase
MKTIASVTVARSDYGIYRPVYRSIMQSPHLKLQVIAAGAHFSPLYGQTIRELERDGMPIAARVDLPMEAGSDTPAGITAHIGQSIAELGRVYDRLRPDVLLVLGDRIEMAAAVLAAQPFNIPVAHLHGGEVSLGAIDDVLRHAITQLSAIHFVSHEDHGRRVKQMGQDPSRIVVCGAPALDNLKQMTLQSRDQILQQYGLKLPDTFALVVFHPVTRQPGQAASQVAALLSAMKRTGLACVIGYPNADAENQAIIQQIEAFVQADPRSITFRNVGIETYFSLMSHAKVMVGNSSSGIIEAASLKLPVVNVGDRQKGRLHGINVFDTPCETQAIINAITQATSPQSLAAIASMTNPYGDGQASQRITAYLESLVIDDSLRMRPFRDL